MATTIKIRNSATPGAVPSSLAHGEFAINVTDDRLYYGSGSAVKQFTGIDTGSFASTGSNVFIGVQTVTGSVEITGAITASVLSASYIDFDGNTPAYANGRLFYDSANGALGFYNEEQDVTLQIGQEFWIYGKNDSGQVLANGTPVRISGANGASMLFDTAIAEDHTTASVYDNHLIGVLTHEVDINGFGYVTVEGVVRDVDTSDFTAGDILYLQTGSGGFRNTPPPFPYDIVQIGFVKRVQSQNGEVFVKVQEPVHFGNISGLSGSASEPGDLWIYQANNAWSPGKTLSGSYIISNGNLNVQGNITASGNISGSQTGSFAYLQLPGFEFDSAAASTELVVNGDISASGNIEATSFTGSYQGTFTQVTGLTITSQSWGLDGSIYSSSLSNANILANSLVEVIPSNSDYSIVLAAQLLPQNSGSSGQVTVFAVNEPTDDINVTINIFN